MSAAVKIIREKDKLIIKFPTFNTFRVYLKILEVLFSNVFSEDNPIKKVNEELKKRRKKTNLSKKDINSIKKSKKNNESLQKLPNNKKQSIKETKKKKKRIID